MTTLLDQPFAEEDEIVRVTLVPEDIRLLLVAADVLQKDGGDLVRVAAEAEVRLALAPLLPRGL